VAAYAGIFLFGIVMALLGAILPLLSDRLRFDLAQVGTLFLVMNACMLTSSLTLGPLMDRFGTKPPLALGPVLVGAALLAVATASDRATLLWAVGVLGLGGGALNSAANTLVAELHGDPRRKSAALNLLGVFFGFGALLLPFLIGLLLRTLGLDGILRTAALLCLVVTAHNALVAFPVPKREQRLPAPRIVLLLREPLVLALGGLLFFESGNEFIVGGFVSTHLTAGIGMGVAAASYALAAYWAALMLARLTLSRVALRVPGHRLVLLSALASAVAVALLVATRHPPVAALALVLTGAALAGIYPTVLGVAGARFAASTGTVFGILFTAGLAGGMTLPWLTGQIAAALGLRLALGLVVGQFLAIAGLQVLAGRILQRERTHLTPGAA
jgi:fucose permease